MTEQDEAARMKALREAVDVKERALNQAENRILAAIERAPWQHTCPECGTWHNRKGAAR